MTYSRRMARKQAAAKQTDDSSEEETTTDEETTPTEAPAGSPTDMIWIVHQTVGVPVRVTRRQFDKLYAQRGYSVTDAPS